MVTVADSVIGGLTTKWGLFTSTTLIRSLNGTLSKPVTFTVAIELLMADDRSVLIPEGTQNIDLASKVQLYQAEIDRTLPKYVEMVVFE